MGEKTRTASRYGKARIRAKWSKDARQNLDLELYRVKVYEMSLGGEKGTGR